MKREASARSDAASAMMSSNVVRRLRLRAGARAVHDFMRPTIPSSTELLWNRAPCYSNSGDRSQAIVCRSRVSRRPTLRKVAAFAIGIVALLSVALAPPDPVAWPQAARTIRVIISVPPGGSIDLLVRILADYISTAKGQSIIVESRPGAGGIIAAEAVARARPDGNTLLVNNNGMIISSILRKVNYDPQASFEPICYLVTPPQ